MRPRVSACHICGQGSFCRCDRPIGWDYTHPEPPNFPVAPAAEGVQRRPGLVRRCASDRLQFAGQNAAQLLPSQFSTAPGDPPPTDEFTNPRTRRGAFSTHSPSQQSSPFTNTPSESGSFANPTDEFTNLRIRRGSFAIPTFDSSPATSNNSFTNSAYNASPLDSNNYFPAQTPRSSPVNSNSSGAQFGASQPVPPVDNRSQLWAPKPLRVTKNIAQIWADAEAFTNNPAPDNAQQSRKRTLTEAPHYDNEEERYHKKYRRD
ncbi:hypothetical protein OCU04_009380 [Sclerotinia nivalis]|uniref:Uncharacterized protein n=1 Tax=Sclerotinia nivalis TaxID=352851 RepID=A0A9X0AG43_9HELO|nr:hypothetical protein OCU04_009380 [Sclerotinia nivalis]